MKEKIMEILTGLRPECDFENSENFIEEGLLDSMDISAKNFSNLDSIVELIEKYK